MIGKWAICGKGMIGKIEGQKGSGEYVGKKLDGKPWRSWKPTLLTPADQKALEGLVEKAWMYDGLAK